MRTLHRDLATALATQRRQTQSKRLLADAQRTWLAYQVPNCDAEQAQWGGIHSINAIRCTHRMLTERVTYLNHLAAIARQTRYWPGADVHSGEIPPRPPACAGQPDIRLPETYGRLAPLAILEAELDVANKALRLLSEAEMPMVRSQAAWRQFRAANCKFEQTRANSVHRDAYDFCLRRMTAERLDYLRAEY